MDKIFINDGHINYLENKIINKFNKIYVSKENTYFQVGDFYLQELNTDLLDENDSSSIYYVENKNIKMLFTGDASKKSEEYIMSNYNLDKINILKVGHHGSDTSSSEEFIDKIKPTTCLISVGKDNKFGHPKKSVLDTLDDYCNIYRTDLNGSIEIKLNNGKYEVRTCSS